MPGLITTPKVVPTTLNFLSPSLKEKPYFYSEPIPEKPATNIVTEEKPVNITDLRSLSPEELATFHTDTSGFQIHKHVSAEKDFTDEERIKSVYYPETAELLKAVTGAKRVFIFDHTIRSPATQKTTKLRGPVLRAHVDQTPKAGAERVFLHLGDDAERLSKGRAQIINVWRPIKKVESTPLAYADYRSVDFDKDLVPADLIYPHRVGETFSLRHNSNQHWYYYSQQEPDTVVLLKCYESEVVDGRARVTPHSAFVDPTSAEDAPQRHSIEVRALVFYEE